MSNTIDHIPFATLVDLVEGRYTSDERTQAHLTSCSMCARDVAWLQQIIVLMRTDQSEAAPASVVARAKRLFRPQAAPARPSLRQRITAALSFDSARSPLALGMRGEGQSERQLLFSAGDLAVDLRITPASSLWAVSGQVLGAADGRQITLAGARGAAQATLNELSEFVLPPVPAGSYTITLQLDGLDVDIPAIEIGSAG